MAKSRFSVVLGALIALGGCGGTGSVLDSGTDGALACCDAWIAEGGVPADGNLTDGSMSPCRHWPTDRPIRVLFVGNSQIDFWDMAQLVSSLSESAPEDCARITGERFTVGGANLRTLWSDADRAGRRLPEVLATGGYDAVVITESIDLVELRPPYPEQFTEDAQVIVDAARAAGALPILYATPYVERPDHTGFHDMADPQLALGEQLAIPVAAGGLAWLRVWEQEPGADLYFTDRAHPGFHGSYISGLVIWSTLTGGTPVGLTASPETTCEDVGCTPISPDQADLYQSAAWAQQLETGR